DTPGTPAAAGKTPASEPESPAAPSPLVGGAAARVAPPELIASTRVAPVYPERARRFRHRCRVTVELLIDTSGAVREAKVLEETIRGFGFGREAVRAVRQWRYTPARVDGRPVEYREKVVINFVP
ncbi:MAG: TonB family protein, partial [Acidobacteria bacterium]